MIVSAADVSQLHPETQTDTFPVRILIQTLKLRASHSIFSSESGSL
jgi:hypothetical protein